MVICKGSSSSTSYEVPFTSAKSKVVVYPSKYEPFIAMAALPRTPMYEPPSATHSRMTCNPSSVNLRSVIGPSPSGIARISQAQRHPLRRSVALKINTLAFIHVNILCNA
ncbi:MAG: hypothetical protein KAU48_07425 [Candidatus Thorarchaeota archaeon]|nr:hypothetical protein [Candidatus Thorarchaeota archaeon]